MVHKRAFTEIVAEEKLNGRWFEGAFYEDIPDRYVHLDPVLEPWCKKHGFRLLKRYQDYDIRAIAMDESVHMSRKILFRLEGPWIHFSLHTPHFTRKVICSLEELEAELDKSLIQLKEEELQR
jgi:hypothetical protein